MKIAILTQLLWGNYGCILQNYALQMILKRMGHDPYTVCYYGSTIKHWFWDCIKLFIKHIINHPDKVQRLNRLNYHLYNHNRGVGEFCVKHIKRTKPMLEITSSMSFVREYDAFIVGSDQVWRPQYNSGPRLDYMYLDFLKDIDKKKKIAYAASFGVDEWEYDKKQTEKYKKLIKQFDAISVRESSGVDLCAEYLQADAIQVLDPSLLLSAEDYQLLVPNEDRFSQGDVCVYILDMTEAKQVLIETFCRKKNLTWYTVGVRRNNGDMPSVESWLAGFMNAKYVITDSFHGSVFSIIFNKPFVSIGNDARGMSRFNSLFKMFGLENRLINPNDSIEKIDEPDWVIVNKKLKKWQKKSIDFLNENLRSKS